jgi:hypothetical protein
LGYVVVGDDVFGAAGEFDQGGVGIVVVLSGVLCGGIDAGGEAGQLGAAATVGLGVVGVAAGGGGVGVALELVEQVVVGFGGGLGGDPVGAGVG